MSSMIGTITPNPSIDQHILIDELVKDDAIRARESRRDPGGKGINVSRVIKELGGKTVAFGVAGGCVGYMLKSLMAEKGIEFEALEVSHETRMNVILTDRSDRTQTRISMAGPRLTLVEANQFLTRIIDHLPMPEWWVLGGSLAPGMPNDFYAKVITSLQGRGVKCVLDADEEAFRIGVQAKPYLIKPNEYEIARLVGRDLPDEGAMISAAQQLVREGIGIVVITLGPKGAFVVSKDSAFRALTPKVEVKSKVGAGDSFLAGCVLGLSQSLGLEEGVRLGMAAGTAAVMSEGTQLCRRQDVERLLKEIVIEPLKPLIATPSKVSDRLIQDVICGMKIDPQLVSYQAFFRGTKYQFCSLKCQKEFQQDPEHYVVRSGADS